MDLRPGPPVDVVTTPLTGGRYTKGVVRIGDTVRRPVSPKSPFTAELLRLLEERGFDSVPRYLGQDDEDRDVLTYLDGWVPARYARWTDEQVAAVGRLLRAFHDATRGSRLAGHHPRTSTARTTHHLRGQPLGSRVAPWESGSLTHHLRGWPLRWRGVLEAAGFFEG